MFNIERNAEFHLKHTFWKPLIEQVKQKAASIASPPILSNMPTFWKESKILFIWSTPPALVHFILKMALFTAKVGTLRPKTGFQDTFLSLGLRFYRTRVRSLGMLVSDSLTNSLTLSYLVNLIDVTLTCEDANS